MRFFGRSRNQAAPRLRVEFNWYGGDPPVTPFFPGDTITFRNDDEYDLLSLRYDGDGLLTLTPLCLMVDLPERTAKLYLNGIEKRARA